MSRILITLTLIFSIVLSAEAIKKGPKWIDASYRNQTYPNAQYLKGFASQRLSKKAGNIDDAFHKLKETARTELVQSIRANIASESVLSITNVNAETQESFKQKTVVLSSAEIVGLKFETYHDLKDEIAYAFAYASVLELESYYNKQLQQATENMGANIKSAQNALGSDNRLALKSYASAYKEVSKAEEAQALMIALGERNDGKLRLAELNELKGMIKAGISKVQSNDKLTIEDAAYILCMSFDKPTTPTKVYLEPFTFEDTEKGSDFSKRFEKSVEKMLVESGDYSLSMTKSGADQILKGSYWKEENRIKILAVIGDSTSAGFTSAESEMPLSWMENNTIEYLPEEVKRLNAIQNYTFKIIGEEKLKGKSGKTLKTPLIIEVTANGTPVEGLPVRFFFPEGDQTSCSIKSDKNGKAQCKVDRMPMGKQLQVIRVEPDLEKYLNISKDSKWHQTLKAHKNLPGTRYLVEVEGVKVYVQSKEKNMGKDLTTAFIGPSIKAALSAKGYSFVEKNTEADFILTISSDTRESQGTQGIYFAYLTANISLTDLESGASVFEEAFDNIKHVGQNFDQAGLKAYQKGTPDITQKVVEALVK